jgi:hypothetical protein
MKLKNNTKHTKIILDYNLQTCIVFAARYAHKRNTGAALGVTSAIKT